MNLSTGRVLIIVALVVAGLAVLANGFLELVRLRNRFARRSVRQTFSS